MADAVQKLVWVDLEMTGLDDKECAIIEIAVIITDFEFKELAHYHTPIWQPDSVLSAMSPYVRTMHTQNGLLERVRQSAVSVEDAQKKFMELLVNHTKYKKGLLAGNSVWQDRRFLMRYMPHVEDYLHYRQVDVSSVKALVKEWYGPALEYPQKTSSHEALGDIRHSIEELKWYRQHVFVAKGSKAV